MSWIQIRDKEQHKAALELSRGSYQRGLLTGVESLSGSTLRGLAASYSGKYRISRDNLLKRLTNNGVVWSEQIGKNNRRILVIGE